MTTVTPTLAAELLGSLRYVLLDIDGVLWSGNHVFPKIPETISQLRSRGLKVRFLSNNASHSRQQLCARFAASGIEGVTEEEVYNSGYAAALYLRSLASKCGSGLFDRNVFVIGEEGLHHEIRQSLAPGCITYGLELHDVAAAGGYSHSYAASAWAERVLPEPMTKNGKSLPPSGKVSLSDLDVGAVIVGLDLHFNMLKLACASLCLQKRAADGVSPAAVFIATNEDPQIPIGEQGLLLPGAGAMVSSLQTVSGRAADVVCGKPRPNMAELLFAAEGVAHPEECLMVGDRLTTDIKFGNGVGCRTMLVLTGAESRADVDAAAAAGDTNLIPDFIGDSLACLLR